MAMYAINYDGLRKRDTYNEIIDYLQFHQEKITYPDRFAKRIRETPQLTNLLDGEGLGHAELQELDKKRAIDMMKEFAIRESGGTASISRVSETPAITISSGSTTPHDYHTLVQDYNDMIHTTLDENIENHEDQINNITGDTNNHLNNVHTQNQNFLLGAIPKFNPQVFNISTPRPPFTSSNPTASSSNQPMAYPMVNPPNPLPMPALPPPAKKAYPPAKAEPLPYLKHSRQAPKAKAKPAGIPFHLQARNLAIVDQAMQNPLIANMLNNQNPNPPPVGPIALDEQALHNVNEGGGMPKAKAKAKARPRHGRRIDTPPY